MNVSRFFMNTKFRELSTIDFIECYRDSANLVCSRCFSFFVYTFLLLVKRTDYLMTENYRI